MQIKPYTYVISNEITGHFYIGKKTANKVPAMEDISYWGSSKYLKDLMTQHPEGWTKTIIAEYDSNDETGLAEEKLIKQFWEIPGRVNKSKGQGRGVDHSDPDVKAKHLAAVRTPEHRARRSEIRKNERATESEEVKKKRAKAQKERAKVIIATNITTGESFEIRGNMEMKSLGFDQSHVRACCNGKYSKTNIYHNHRFQYKS